MERVTDKRKETNWCVYMHENRFNNKKYIGITCQKPTNRWKNGRGYDECPRFYNAIQKYGWDGFRHEILYTNLSQTEAEQLEVDLIAKYETRNPDKGYNMTSGGATNSGWHHSPETKEKLSKIASARTLSDDTKRKIGESSKGRVRTDVTRKRLSESLKGRFVGEETRAKLRELNTGKKFSDSARAKMSAQRKGALNARARAVVCVETGTRFSTGVEAEGATGAPRSKICECCKGTRNIAGGYHWRYADEVVTVNV